MKRNKKPRFTHYLSLHFDTEVKTARFDPFFNLMKHYDLKVTNITFYNGNDNLVDKRHRITFAVEGPMDEYVNFREACIEAQGWAQFKDND